MWTLDDLNSHPSLIVRDILNVKITEHFYKQDCLMIS